MKNKNYMGKYKNITLEQFFQNSFVLTIDDLRYKQFLKRIKTITDGDTLPRKFSGYQEKTRTGAQNCAKSHFVMVSYAKKKKLPFIVIFEDDAYPCIECKQKLTNFLKNIPKNINFLLLGWSDSSNKTNQSFDLLFNRIETIFSGSHSYIIFQESYDQYLNFFKNNPNQTADGFIFNNINNSYVLNKPLFIQVNESKSMNGHIGYVYYGDNKEPPTGFEKIYDKTIYIFSNANPYNSHEIYSKKLQQFNYDKNSTFVFLNTAVPYFSNISFFNSKNDKFIIHRGAFNRDTGIWKEYFGQDDIRPFVKNFSKQFLINYELVFSKQTVIDVKNKTEIDYHFEDLTMYPNNQTPTTGFLAYFMCKNLFPYSKIQLVNFLGEKNNTTPKAKCHHWNFEYDYFNKINNIKIGI